LTLSEIAGPVLASIAVVLSVIVFKRTVDYQAYKDVDSDYREVLKIGLDHPDFRNPEWTSEYTKKDPKEKLSYEQAFRIFLAWLKAFRILLTILHSHPLYNSINDTSDIAKRCPKVFLVFPQIFSLLEKIRCLRACHLVSV
jgi:hypothetical protein